METKKKGFIIHENYYEQVRMLSHEERGRLFLALFEYHREGRLPEDFSPLLSMAFVGFRQAMDQDRIAYERRCEVNRVNGKKGGRGKKENQTQTKKADMDMGMDMEMGMGMGMDMGMDMGMEEIFVSDGSAGIRRLSEEEKEELIFLGVPAAYIEERAERATAYGAIHGKKPSDVLLAWWRGDEKRKSRHKPKSPVEPLSTPKSYDLDEFFEAALQRGLQDLSGDPP